MVTIILFIRVEKSTLFLITNCNIFVIFITFIDVIIITGGEINDRRTTRYDNFLYRS